MGSGKSKTGNSRRDALGVRLGLVSA